MGFLEYIRGEEKEPKSVLEPGVSGETRYEVTPEGGVAPVETSPLPAIGGVLGTIAGVAGQNLPYVGPVLRLGAATQPTTMFGKVGQMFGPSLIGSTAGTSLGLGTETLFTGQPIPSGRIADELITNAIFDVGGNLVFSVAGKTLKIGKDALSTVVPFLKDKSPEAAREAAQRFLSGRGATLSRGQLTGSDLSIGIEEVARGGTGAPAFRAQEKKVKEAIQSGVDEFKNKLDISDEFRTAIKQGDPTQTALGDTFKNALNVARTEFKSVHRPFYDKLTEDTGVFVNMVPIKTQAQAEYDRLAKLKFRGAEDRKKVLEDILAQDDTLDFGLAHELRSNFGASAKDAVKPGGVPTVMSREYSKVEEQIEKAMDSAFTSIKAKNPNLVQEYNVTKQSYKEGMQGLYNNTINKAIELDPEAIGKYLFDPNTPSRFREINKAVAQIDKYKRQDVVNGLKYGFIDQVMSSPENVLKLQQTLESNKQFRDGFNALFSGAGEKEFLTNVLSAAKYGLDEGLISQVARNRLSLEATRVVGQAATVGGGYLLLPNDVKDKIGDNLPEAITTAGVLFFTPRFISKAMTNKKAQDALIKIGQAQNNPKLAGALSGKIVNLLNESGIIDSQYIDEVNGLINKASGQVEQTPPPTAQQPQSNFLEYLNQQE